MKQLLIKKRISEGVGLRDNSLPLFKGCFRVFQMKIYGI